MKKLSVAALSAALVLLAVPALAQQKPYKEGTVTEVSSIKVKPGHFSEYMQWLDASYKPLMEAYKKAGLILGYGVYGTQPRSPRDPDLYLTITYANMAALDRIEESEALSAKVVGPAATQNKQFEERGTMREVLGSELIRELVLK